MSTVVQELLTSIKLFDCEPSVYSVSLVAAAHKIGYGVTVTFRSNIKGRASNFSTNDSTPEGALEIALDTLRISWGKCQHCGEYPANPPPNSDGGDGSK